MIDHSSETRMDLIDIYGHDIRKARLMLKSLSIYRCLLEDSVIAVFGKLLDTLDNCRFDLAEAVQCYCDFYRALTDSGQTCDIPGKTNRLKNHIILNILFNDNCFTRTAEAKDCDSIDDGIKLAVSGDLSYLQQISQLSPSAIKTCMSSCLASSDTGYAAEIIRNLPAWYEGGGCYDNCSDVYDSGSRSSGHTGLNHWNAECIEPVIEMFYTSTEWSKCIRALCEFHRKHGSGIFARYRAFVWERTGSRGFLKGIENYDPVTFTDLIGYDAERSDVVKNTLQFLDGFPANNILLYGDRGTGKSSTVKALLNEYHSSGLRMIEVPKMYLRDFPAIVSHLRDRNMKFIIFVDDLVFEDNEENYTALKAVLEGGLESKPSNVLIYATSNRRHLLKERFSDRSGLLSGNADDEVRAADSIQEKLSLADRFGITVVFSSPDKEKYLQIVEGIALKRGLDIDRETLHGEAMKWELWYNGRSPRTARQFIDWLEGHMGRKS